MTTHPRPKPAAFLVTLVSASSFAEHYHKHPVFSSFLIFLAAFFSFILLRCIYRLTFHPLARYPGPKLAAVTHWYAAYYNVIKDGGFLFVLPELFEKYGPIVRIYPDELAVKDIASYNEAFKIGGKYIKDPIFYEHPLLNDSVLCTIDPRLARERREALGPHFSKNSVRQLQPVIRSKVARLLQRIDEFLLSPSEKTVAQNPKAGSKSGQWLNLSRAYRCLTADVITKCSYDKSFGGLDDEEFFPTFLKGFYGAAETVWLEYYLKTIMGALVVVCRKLPKSLLKIVSLDLYYIQEFEDQCRDQVLFLKNNPNPPPSIFDKLLHPEPKSPTLHKAATFPSYGPPSSPTSSEAYTNVPSDKALTAEAVLTLAAGMDTTGHTLTMATYNLISHPEKQARLLEELKTIMPGVDGGDEVSSDDLEKLPYLSAVIRETLRLTAGVPGPIPRVVPRAGTKIAGIPVPGGTSISHAQYIYHYDPNVFPDPEAWIPERWLQATPEMNQYWMPFSRGSRQCLGMNLAYAELYSTIAAVFRRYEMSLNETAHQDMTWKDMYVPVTNGHLRVRVDSIRKE